MRRCTTSEAKNFFCPISMSRMSTAPCTGHECMAWAWQTVGEYSSSADKPEGEGWVQKHRQWRRDIPVAERIGFCGMVPPDTVQLDQ